MNIATIKFTYNTQFYDIDDDCDFLNLLFI